MCYEVNCSDLMSQGVIRVGDLLNWSLTGAGLPELKHRF